MNLGTPFPFVAFSLVIAILYRAVRSLVWRQGLLFAANLLFLASFVPTWQSAIPLAAFLILEYLALLWAKRTPGVFVPILIATVAAFAWLKQYAFVPQGWLLPSTYVTIGLSYIFFRVLHLIIATHSNALAATPGPLAYFDYTASFLTLASGPVQLYTDYCRTRAEALVSTFRWDEIAGGCERIVKGLFKTNVLALVFSTLHERGMQQAIGTASGGTQIAAAGLMFAAYPLFLYCNFSGFIDLVLGSARLLGWTLPENFNRPFAAENFMDFWSNRWHITLSSWLKTYVYNPLLVTLMRRNSSRAMEPFLGVFVFFVTFFLVGIWHGQTAEMLLYGVLLGLGVSVNKLFQVLLTAQLGRKRYNALASSPLYAALARGLTFTYVALTLILFWSNAAQMRELAASLGAGLAVAGLLVLVGATVILSLWESVRAQFVDRTWNEGVLGNLVRTAFATAMFVTLLAINLLMNQSAPDIVYKAF